MGLLTRFIATGIFSGYAPIAPGTFGSLVGVALYWLIPGSESLWFATVIILVTVAGALCATSFEKNTGIADNQIIVIDEIVGVWIALLGSEKTWPMALAAFLLFRLFDIWKPTPVRQAERFPGGWGVMMDDVAAGLYAFASLRLLMFVWESFA